MIIAARMHILRYLFIGMVFGLPFTTWAFTLPDTGITNCFDAGGNIIPCPQPGQPLFGQDAQYGPGAMSFALNGDGTAIDNNTAYVWELKAATDGSPSADPADPDNTYTWEQAASLVNSLNISNYKGHNDWRLPSVAELDSILDLSVAEPGPMVDIQVFSTCRPGAYWTSDIDNQNSAQAWVLNFSTGETGIQTKMTPAYLRLVRGGLQ